MSSLPTYPNMKPSGVEWLGEIPERWSTVRLRHVGKVIGGGTPVSDRTEYWGGDIPWVTPADFGPSVPKWIRGGTRTLTSAGLQNSSAKLLEPGAVLVTSRAPVGEVRLSAVPLGTNQGIRAIETYGSVDPEYLYYLLTSVTDVLQAFANGTTFNELRGSSLSMLPVLLPSMGEQQAIARYLDHVDFRIRRAIIAKKKLIKLLEEAKQVVIAEAVTKGLDPTVPMKPSGVEWLGDIPEHWHAVRLGAVLVERKQLNTDGRVSQVLSLVRNRGVIRYEDKGNIGNKKSEDTSRYKVVRAGDIVLNSMNVIIGSVSVSRLDGCLSPVYYVLRPRSENLASYYGAVFDIPTFHKSLICLGNGILAHRMRIPMEKLRTELVPRPPLDEQQAIVRYLDEHTAEFDRQIDEARRLVGLLEEYRVRLIADVVTGKVDVREAAATLGDLADVSVPDEDELGTVGDMATDDLIDETADMVGM